MQYLIWHAMSMSRQHKVDRKTHDTGTSIRYYDWYYRYDTQNQSTIEKMAIAMHCNWRPPNVAQSFCMGFDYGKPDKIIPLLGTMCRKQRNEEKEKDVAYLVTEMRSWDLDVGYTCATDNQSTQRVHATFIRPLQVNIRWRRRAESVWITECSLVTAGRHSAAGSLHTQTTDTTFHCHCRRQWINDLARLANFGLNRATISRLRSIFRHSSSIVSNCIAILQHAQRARKE